MQKISTEVRLITTNSLSLVSNFQKQLEDDYTFPICTNVKQDGLNRAFFLNDVSPCSQLIVSLLLESMDTELSFQLCVCLFFKIFVAHLIFKPPSHVFLAWSRVI